nr:AsnC family protein [Halovivax sp. TS33]
MTEFDNVDRGILHELRLNAWNRSVQEITDKVDVSASTVRNQIEQLKDDFDLSFKNNSKRSHEREDNEKGLVPDRTSVR